MAQETHRGTNSPANSATESIRDQWLDVQPDGLTADSLKAKNWQTDTRKVGDRTFHGNLHHGRDEELPFSKQDGSEEVAKSDPSPVAFGKSDLEQHESLEDGTVKETRTGVGASLESQSALSGGGPGFAALDVTYNKGLNTPDPEDHLQPVEANRDTVATERGSRQQSFSEVQNPLPSEMLPPREEDSEDSDALPNNDPFPVRGKIPPGESSLPRELNELDPEQLPIPPQAASITGSGASVAEDGLTSASGQLQITDPNSGEELFVSGTRNGTYGTFQIFENGYWVYTLNNEAANVQALRQGETVTETFVVSSADGTSHTLTFSVCGTNDTAIIGGTASAAVAEDGNTVATGTLTVTDRDSGEAHFRATTDTGIYGSLRIGTDGQWRYTLNNESATVQALGKNDIAEETFIVSTVDGTEQRITLIISGTNDTAVITGTTTGIVSEDDLENVTGMLTVTDKDAGEAFFTSATHRGTYGSFSIDTDGQWHYQLDNNAANVQALGQGDFASETFTVTSADGSADQRVTITLTGSNDTAIITGTAVGSVTEDTLLNSTGRLAVSDVDSGEAHFTAATHTGTYGTLIIDENGDWRYTLDSTSHHVQRLNAETIATDIITVTSADGTPHQVAISVTGSNDVAIITGAKSGSTTEDQLLSVSGRLNITDIDSGEACFLAASYQGVYGSLLIDENGNWTYSLDNSAPHVQALQGDTIATDMITVASVDGSATSHITITIAGTNDDAIITGASSGSVTEDEKVIVSGTLAVSDVDSGEDHFTATTLIGTYGTLAIDQAGHWSYALDIDVDSIQSLRAGDVATDTVTITSADGTTHQITITIDGTNDTAVIGGTCYGSVSEETLLVHSGTLAVSDTDNHEAAFIAASHTGSYGSLVIDDNGHWSYTLDNTADSIQFLGAGATVFDTIVVQSLDGTSQQITVSINGTNDAALISGARSGSVSEDGVTSVSGSLTVEDRDSGDAHFIAATHTGTSGSFSIGTDGQWHFQLDNNAAHIQALGHGDFASETFTVNSADGTAQQITVTIAGSNDAPVVGSVSLAPLAEDTARIITGAQLLAASHDIDGSDTLQVGDLAVDERYGSLHDNGNGTWTFTPIHNLDASDIPFSFTVSDGHERVTGSAILDLVAVADAPVLTTQAAAGREDTAIALNISTALTDLDGSETLSAITISGMPTGAILSAGTNNGNGTWTVSAAQLNGLTITPPTNSDSDFTLGLSVTATDTSGSTSTSTASLPVTVSAVVDTPNMTVTAAKGNEDTAITLNIKPLLSDTDGSENLSVTIAGVPSGAKLSAGINNGDGSWTLTSAQLSGLKITPPANSDADFQLQVTATSAERENGDRASTSTTLDVTVTAMADTPTLTVAAAKGDEDTAISLNITSALMDLDGSESLSYTISGVPIGAKLSAGTVNANGSWTLTPTQLSGLTITPPANSDTDFTLTVTASSTETENLAKANRSAQLRVTVNAVTDTPTLAVAAASSDEDSTVALHITSALTDKDGSENLAVVIGNVPAGAKLTAGKDNSDGTWTLTPAQLNELGIKLAPNSDTDFELTINAISTETATGTRTVTTSTLPVTVNAVADIPLLSVSSARGEEDNSIRLNITSSLSDTDGSEKLGVVIGKVPNGANLSAGTNNGDGTWTLTPAQLSGLTITPPANSDTNFTLSVTAIATEDENGSSAQRSYALPVTVSAVADLLDLGLETAVGGSEDGSIALHIDAGLIDTDGSESLTLVLDGVPAGALLSAGTNNGDGSWTLNLEQLADLAITPPRNSDRDFTLTLSATTLENANGDRQTTTLDIPVQVSGVADAAVLSAGQASGTEDRAIDLNLSAALTDTDGSETLTITISGLPAGSVLSAGTLNNDGSYTLTPAQLRGLTVTPPTDSGEDFHLSITATSSEREGDIHHTTIEHLVTVQADADAPVMAVQPARGEEDGAISLDITSRLTDLDGSELLSITISDIPEGAVLSAGTLNDDGSYTLNTDQLSELTITPPADSDTDFILTVTATSIETENGDRASTVLELPMAVNAVADTPTITTALSQGWEDRFIALKIDPVLTDTDGSETVSLIIAGLPSGAKLSAGTPNADGSWSVATNEIAGLSILPPADYSGDFTLSVTAVATEADGGTSTHSTTVDLPVSVTGAADTPGLTVRGTTGDEDAAIALDISTAMSDDDGSESIAISIAGVPRGAILSAGSDNGDGSWTLSTDQLPGLTITPPHDADTDFTLTVTATSSERDGDQTAVSYELPVTVNGVADALIIAGITNAAEGYILPSVVGHEDTAIPLDLSLASGDVDGSEQPLSILVRDVPAGVRLSAGIDNGDGSWTLSQAQMHELSVIPPQDCANDFTLHFEITNTESGSGHSSVTSFDVPVTVAAVADGVVLRADSASGLVDQPIALNILHRGLDGDNSESYCFVVGKVPTGAVLSAGTDNGNGSWTLSAGQLSGLTITPPAGSDEEFTLTVTATSTEMENQDSISNHIELPVYVNTSISGGSGGTGPSTVTTQEDTAIAIDLASRIPEIVDAISGTITINGVPEGAMLSAGQENSDGTWTLTIAEANGLSLIPAENSGANIYLHFEANLETEQTAVEQPLETVSAASEIKSTSVSITSDLLIRVTDVADAPELTGDKVTAAEHTPTAVGITADLVDSDGSEHLSITISGVPQGAALSAGNDNGDGTWTLSANQLKGLTITTPRYSSEDFILTVTATSTEYENNSQASTSFQLPVTVSGSADAPILAVKASAGAEDSPINLHIDPALVDTDGSESLAITITGVPTGAILSAGNNNNDGSWSLTAEQLSGLTITPSNQSGQDFTLTVIAISTEADSGSTTQTVRSLPVIVNAVADALQVVVEMATGSEDKAIALYVTPTLLDSDGSELVGITADGIPDGAMLSAGSRNDDGSWNLTLEELQGLTVTPPANSDEDFTIHFTATTVERENGNTTFSQFDIPVTVNPVVDGITIVAEAVTGREDSAIALSITAAITDIDGSETNSITLSGVPVGATLSAGSDNGDGTWTLTAEQLSGLTITPPADSATDFTLTLTTISAEATGGSVSTSYEIPVTVLAVADSPILSGGNATGQENQTINLDIRTALSDVDGSESLSALTISGVPQGAILSTGTNNGDGSWTLTAEQLDGLTLTPSPYSDSDFNLTVRISATEAEGDNATSTVTIPVSIAAVANTPQLAVNSADGNEDSVIALDIQAALADTDGSESLSISVSGVPVGAHLSAGTENGDGSWTLTGDQLEGLTIRAPRNSSEEFTLTVTATSTEATGGNSTVTTALAVTVNAVADTPTLRIDNAAGLEDRAIALDITSSMTDTDGSESLSITISGVPGGATLSAGSDHGDGSWTLTPNQLAGLTIIPPADSNTNFNLTVTATSTEAEGGQTTTSYILPVSVEAIADGMVFTSAASGDEDTAIRLNLTAIVADRDGSETMSDITVSGMPDGTFLSAGTRNDDGTWTLSTEQLEGLTITPSPNSGDSFNLVVSARTTEGGSGAETTTTYTLPVSVRAVADAPILSASAVSGSEDAAIALNIVTGLTDTDGSETLSAVIISGMPEGARLSAGTDNGDGSWTIAQNALAGLTITPTTNSDGDFTLRLAVSSMDGSGSVSTTTADLPVTVLAVADAPILSASNSGGSEDMAIVLDIRAALSDIDGSETLSAVTIRGVPTGAILSTGTNNGNGTWTISADQLEGLTLTPPANSSEDFTLALAVTSRETSGGSSRTSTAQLQVSLTGLADTPTLTVTSTDGAEDSAIPLSIASALTDRDGSELLAVTISGIPDGATLSSGTSNGDGTWTLAAEQLPGLTMTPPENAHGEIQLTITARSTEVDGDDTVVTHTATLTVNAVNDLASISGDTRGEATEDTTTTVSGTLSVSDVDGGEAHFTAATQQGTFGSLEIDENGQWDFTLDNNADNVQGLGQGDTATDTITVATADGTTEQVTITIAGTNDAAQIGGDTTGEVTEDTATTVSGSLSVSDVDSGEAHFTAATHQGTFGSLEIDESGQWNFILDNNADNVQGLGQGDTATDTITVATADGTTEQVTITIAGTNDAAQISGDVTSKVTEDTATTVSGILSVSDVDSGEAHFTAATHQGTFGSLKIDEGGRWTYTLDNDADNVQKLGQGDTVTDTLTVASADGTTEQINITIAGSDDAADDTADDILLNQDHRDILLAAAPEALETLAISEADVAAMTFAVPSISLDIEPLASTEESTAAPALTNTLSIEGSAAEVYTDEIDILLTEESTVNVQPGFSIESIDLGPLPSVLLEDTESPPSSTRAESEKESPEEEERTEPITVAEEHTETTPMVETPTVEDAAGDEVVHEVLVDQDSSAQSTEQQIDVPAYTEPAGDIDGLQNSSPVAESESFQDPLDTIGQDPPSIALTEEQTTISANSANLDIFVVTDNLLENTESVNGDLQQFAVSDSAPATDEIPALDGLDPPPSESTKGTAEDAGIGAEDANIPEEISEPATLQEETAII